MSKQHTCVVCGCTDDRACPGGCSWALKFKHGNAGVCSCCTDKFMCLQAIASPELRNLYPLVLYLPDKKSAEELVAIIHEAHPHLKERKLNG